MSFVVAAIILAGGESKRMGSPKLILEFQGLSLLLQAIHKANSVSAKTFVVVGKYTDLYRAEAEKTDVKVLENTAWQEGLASSLRTGIQALTPGIEATLVLLADQPFVPVDHLHLLLKTWQESQVQLVFSRYQNTLGAPCVIDQSLFEEVNTLRGDKGARALVNEGVRVAEVELEGFQDVDTLEDLARLDKIGHRRN
ncbi:MAG: nucleotidyltransferase family protein [Trueperaceae bacterium]